MQDQLRRIKNKDISTLDQRLFGNIEKVETISQTIQNLGHFQKFLLAQITHFQEKAKNQKNSKQLTQVIEQNCMTLRESILRVIPDIQDQKSRLKQSNFSPIKGFSSTSLQKFNSSKLIEKDILDQRNMQMQIKINQMNDYKRKILRKYKQLNDQVIEIRRQKEQLKKQLDEVGLWLRIQLQKDLKGKIDILFDNLSKVQVERSRTQRQNQSLKKQNLNLEEQKKKLEEQNQKISTEIAKLKKKKKSQDEQKISKLFETEILLQKEDQYGNSQFYQVSANRRSIIGSQNYSRFKLNQIEHYQEMSIQNKNQQKSFMDKIKLDFTSKFTTLYNHQQNTFNLDSKSQIHRKLPVTSRNERNYQQENAKKTYQSTNYIFQSEEISKDQHQSSELNVPKLLRKNSFDKSQYHSNPHSIETQGLQASLPLQQMRLNYQSIQKNCQSTTKKSNHDLMRKTKSNFYKQPIQNKENAPNPLSRKLFSSGAGSKNESFGMKKIIDVQNQSNKRRNGQSKQKLKIFSII